MPLILSILTTVMFSVVTVDPPAKPAASSRAAKAKKNVIRLDTLTVEGRIQKPQAFYILQRSNLSFEELSRPESFISKISKSVEKDPL